MRAPSALIDDLLVRPGDQPRSVDPYRHLRHWTSFGIVVFNVACWTTVGFVIHALVAVL